MKVNFSDIEREALEDLCKAQGLNETALLRQALRHYQEHHLRLAAGETCHYSGDDARALAFTGNPQKMSFGEACLAVKENRLKAPYLSRWMHVKSGTVYVVRMNVIIEANLEPAVVYYPQYGEPEVVWCRPASEFFDGRFEFISKETSS
jgi:hypothetical protein